MILEGLYLDFSYYLVLLGIDRKLGISWFREIISHNCFLEDKGGERKPVFGYLDFADVFFF